MKKEFVIQRQGKDMVLFAGLLDLAHSSGLKAIRTRLLQAPAKENGETTIVAAEVEFDGGRIFCGIGDSTPTNVGRNIVPHAIRMAETRAKARALRDGLNINAVSLEELGDDDEPPAPPQRVPSSMQQRPAPAANGNLPEPKAPTKAIYLAADLAKFEQDGKVPGNVVSAAERFAAMVRERAPDAYGTFVVPEAKKKDPTALLAWLHKATAAWEKHEAANPTGDAAQAF